MLKTSRELKLMASTREYRWSSEIMEVMKDPASTAWGAFCPCILFGRNVHSITDGEVSFLRYVVIISYVVSENFEEITHPSPFHN